MHTRFNIDFDVIKIMALWNVWSFDRNVYETKIVWCTGL